MNLLDIGRAAHKDLNKPSREYPPCRIAPLVDGFFNTAEPGWYSSKAIGESIGVDHRTVNFYLRHNRDKFKRSSDMVKKARRYLWSSK